ncbi:GNAT family N-acetyltransferase [Flindersiella endophytica]
MESAGHRSVAITDYLSDPEPDAVLGFLAEWVTEDADAARHHVADHDTGEGTTLVARLDGVVVGLVTVRWTSRNPSFAEQGIPLVHQLAVAPSFRRLGVATALLEAAEQLAAARGRSRVGITVGLFDEYGPAQRLYAKRGYLPDGRGACTGQVPLRLGDTVEVGHDLILWLTKDL